MLDINRTLRLAQDFGVNHPLHGIFPEPLIVDFLITEKCSSGMHFRAVSLVTRAADLKRREQSLMRIQQQWCIEQGIEWTLVETDRLDRTVLTLLDLSDYGIAIAMSRTIKLPRFSPTAL
ncbi:hypothetical protein CUJ88_26630 [Paraburkholderia hospita]|nr:hypothetical protein CUJ88_26630 [Paraburkholderia hospita]